MKQYFDFQLQGRKLFPIWVVFIIFFLIPQIYVRQELKEFNLNAHSFADKIAQLTLFVELYGALILLNIIEYGILLFWIKRMINEMSFGQHAFSFDGQLGQFMKIFIPGVLLSNITMGIYYPWFIARVYRFIANKTYVNSEKMEFKGKGSDLFIITLCCLIIPIILIIIPLMVAAFIAAMRVGPDNATTDYIVELFSAITFLVILVMAIPYIYYFYKWTVQVGYKNYNIKWETSFWPSAGKIASELALSTVTLGIYSPLALVRLYSYFSSRTTARSDSKNFKFGYDIEQQNDFLFIWGQILLTLITLGLYFPWAFCRITQRIVQKTFVIETL